MALLDELVSLAFFSSQSVVVASIGYVLPLSHTDYVCG